MRSSAPYTRATLRGSRRGRGHNSTFVINAERLCLRCPPSLQLADIPSVDISSADILSADIPSTSWTKTSKEEKVNIIKDFLYKWGWSFHRLVSKYLESENGHKGNKKKKKVRDLLIALLENKEI